MEKVLGLIVFLTGSLLSCIAFADVEETFTYGSKTSTGPLNFGDWHKEWLLLGGAGAHAQVAGSEYSNYRADIEKQKYCKANNYPTNVSFCAGYKAKEAEKCKKTASATKLLCQIDYQRAHTNELISCGKVFFSDNLLSQCNKAADSQLVGDLLSCDLGFETNVSKC
jgi:hypothetical protein